MKVKKTYNLVRGTEGKVDMITGLREFAKVVGVSHTTVARALNGSNGVGSRTRQRVLRAAKELNFTPVRHPALKNVVGICVLNISSPCCSQIARGAEDELYRRGYSAAIQSVGVKGRNIAEASKMFQRQGIKGIILQPNCSKVEKRVPISILDLVDSKFPLVLVDRRFPEINSNFITSDNFRASFELVKALYNRGCRHIGFAGYEMQASCHRERFQGYTAGLEFCGLQEKEDLILINDNFDKMGPNDKILSAWLHGDVKLDGILAIDSGIGGRLIQNFNSFDKPFFETCRLAEFDNQLPETYFPYPIISAVQQLYKMGTRAAQIVVDEIEQKKDGKPVQEVLSVSIISESTRWEKESAMVSNIAAERLVAAKK